MKDKIFTRAFIEHLEGRDVVDDQRRALARLEGLPVRRMLDIIQYLESQVIAVLKTNAKRKAEMEMFEEIVDLLLWSIASDDRARFAEKKLGLAKVERQLLIDRLALAESELAKYHACEEMLTTDLLQAYVEGAARRINELKDSNKKKK